MPDTIKQIFPNNVREAIFAVIALLALASPLAYTAADRLIDIGGERQKLKNALDKVSEIEPRVKKLEATQNTLVSKFESMQQSISQMQANNSESNKALIELIDDLRERTVKRQEVEAQQHREVIQRLSRLEATIQRGGR